MHISSSYDKILGGKLFRTWEILRSGSKAKNGEEREKERLNNGENNGQATHGARKHAWRTQAAWAKIYKSIILPLYNVTFIEDLVYKCSFCKERLYIITIIECF